VGRVHGPLPVSHISTGVMLVEFVFDQFVYLWKNLFDESVFERIDVGVKTRYAPVTLGDV
ncbi:MAG: hypothetical protein WA823_11820, partial [Candidatus Acidiferrales bacterium]